MSAKPDILPRPQVQAHHATIDFTSGPINTKSKLCHICGGGVPAPNKCLRRQLSSASLAGGSSGAFSGAKGSAAGSGGGAAWSWSPGSSGASSLSASPNARAHHQQQQQYQQQQYQQQAAVATPSTAAATRAAAAFGSGFRVMAATTKRCLSDVPANGFCEWQGMSAQTPTRESGGVRGGSGGAGVLELKPAVPAFKATALHRRGGPGEPAASAVCLSRVPVSSNRVAVAAESYRGTSVKPVRPENYSVAEKGADAVTSTYVETNEVAQEFYLPVANDDDQVLLDAGDRMPCPICQRKFAGEERLEKHVAACTKLKQPRKVFDATKHRVKGTELEQYVMKKHLSDLLGGKKQVWEKPESTKRAKPRVRIGGQDGAHAAAAATAAPRKKQNWRAKHDSLIRMLRTNKVAPSADAHANAPPEHDPDYVQCSHCGRRFNESAAERHIPICANTKHRPKPAAPKSAVGVVLCDDEARMRRRLDFKPPAPRTAAAKKSGSLPAASPEKKKPR
ncbi:hypothetical protein HDU83_005504 [Entophlyctis luteolus]|nr:hypothetical protein HDU83_005504 [Entophlyctis luteolus]